MGLLNLFDKNKKSVKILAIDTSSNVCSVALLNGKIIVDERNMTNGLTHSENLMPLIDELLKKNDMDLEQIDVIGVCVGPGSFTGIRIGIATILPMAEFGNKQIAGISSLNVLARNVNLENEFQTNLMKNVGAQIYNPTTFKEISNQLKDFSQNMTTATIIPIIDARNNLVYTGIYDTIFKNLEEDTSCDINEAIEIYKKYDNLVFVGDGAVLHKELLQEKLEGKTISFAENNMQKAVNVGLATYDAFKNNQLKSPNEIKPLYLRKSQAERLKKE
jgi:tRNA threonylcarbamoyladenosine biosynthesis protein TsaB